MSSTQLAKRIEDLQKTVSVAVKTINLETLSSQYESLVSQSQQPDLWDDPAKAQKVMKDLAKREQSVVPWQNLQKSLTEISDLYALNDSSLASEIEEQIAKLEKDYQLLEKDLRYNGPYDQSDVILSIYAGAGGTDAQDWAEMLLRMYTRWAEKKNISVETIDISSGDEAGIKSATIMLEGKTVYGKLKGERGVHRLVRQSPFNADALRQTSFAMVEIVPKIDQPELVEIDEKDLKIDVYRASGHGGQSVNTTDSAVRITHIPTGIVVAIQNERSQIQNKETAMTILRSKLAQMQVQQHKEKINELKGPNTSAEWGNQIRNYVLHPYKQVKDTRTNHVTTDVQAVLDGDIDPFIETYTKVNLGSNQ